MNELNQQQKQAATALAGPVAIVAGPGTGKTKTLVARIVHMLESGCEPGRILALTFTKKSAEELAARVAAATDGAQILATTFHGFAHRLIREITGEDWQFIAEPARLQLIRKLVKPAIFENVSTREVALHISRAKNETRVQDALTQQLVKAYNKALADEQLHDFDDLLYKAHELLMQSADSIAQFAQVLVDEFQDTNALQYALLRLLAPHGNLFVIGDPNQSIYGFRGATGGIFERFAEDFPSHEVLTLTTNYRSAPEIVQVGNAVFAKGPQLQAHRTKSGSVQVVQVLNEFSEARYVIDSIQQAIGGGDLLRATHTGGERKLSDFAVLYRSRSAARALWRTFEESGLPYQIVGEGSPYETPRMQELLGLLRACVGQEMPAVKGFSQAQIGTLLEPYVQSTLRPDELAKRLADTFGIESTPALRQLFGTLVRFETLPEVVRYFDDLATQQFYDPQADAITLLTIHAAKGLEFSHVFVIGAEEGVLPKENADEDEERRLFYVALTRSRDELTLLHTGYRGKKPSKLSHFVSEIPITILPQNIDPDLARQAKSAQRRQQKRSQTSLF